MLSTYAEVTSLMSLTMKNLNEIYFVFSNFCVVQCISAVCAQCELDRAAKRNSTSNQTERCQRGRFSTTNSSVHQSIILSKHLFHIKSGSQNAKHQVFFRSDYVCRRRLPCVQRSLSRLYLYVRSRRFLTPFVFPIVGT